MPWYQGGRASEQWGVRVLAPGRAMIWAPPVTTPVEVAPSTETASTDTTDIDVDGVVSIGRRWLVRVLARITITRR